MAPPAACRSWIGKTVMPVSNRSNSTSLQCLPTHAVQLSEEIGEGGSGLVVRGRYLGLEAAIKMVLCSNAVAVVRHEAAVYQVGARGATVTYCTAPAATTSALHRIYQWLHACKQGPTTAKISQASLCLPAAHRCSVQLRLQAPSQSFWGWVACSWAHRSLP